MVKGGILAGLSLVGLNRESSSGGLGGPVSNCLTREKPRGKPREIRGEASAAQPQGGVMRPQLEISPRDF